MDTRIIYAQEDIKISRPSVFLAGPTPRSSNTKSWRPEAISYLSGHGLDIIIPEFKNKVALEGSLEKEFQIQWEEKYMNLADIIIFWIPRNDTDLLGLTTNDEWGYWRAKNPSKLVLGVPPGSFRTDYQVFWAKKLDIPVFDNLKDICSFVIKKINI